MRLSKKKCPEAFITSQILVAVWAEKTKWIFMMLNRKNIRMWPLNGHWDGKERRLKCNCTIRKLGRMNRNFI